MKRFPVISSLGVLITLHLSAAVCPVKGNFPDHPLPRIERYISISVTPKELDLGAVPQPGLYDSPAILTLHVEANCPHGGVVVHATPLESPESGFIPPERILVRVPETGEYVPMRDPVNITGPMGPGVFDLALNFRVVTDLDNAPGKYTGMFVFTFMGDGP